MSPPSPQDSLLPCTPSGLDILAEACLGMNKLPVAPGSLEHEAAGSNIQHRSLPLPCGIYPRNIDSKRGQSPQLQGGVQRTPRAYTGSHPTSRSRSPHPHSPRPERTSPKPEIPTNLSAGGKIQRDSDDTIAKILETLKISRSKRASILAWEKDTLQCLGEAVMDVGAFEDEVTQARHALRRAEHVIVRMKRNFLLRGIAVRENNVCAYATSEDLRRAGSQQISCTGSSVTSSGSQESYDMDSDVFEEPLDTHGLQSWSQGISPDANPDTVIPEREMSSFLTPTMDPPPIEVN